MLMIFASCCARAVRRAHSDFAKLMITIVVLISDRYLIIMKPPVRPKISSISAIHGLVELANAFGPLHENVLCHFL